MSTRKISCAEGDGVRCRVRSNDSVMLFFYEAATKSLYTNINAPWKDSVAAKEKSDSVEGHEETVTNHPVSDAGHHPIFSRIPYGSRVLEAEERDWLL